MTLNKLENKIIRVLEDDDHNTLTNGIEKGTGIPWLKFKHDRWWIVSPNGLGCTDCLYSDLDENDSELCHKFCRISDWFDRMTERESDEFEKVSVKSQLDGAMEMVNALDKLVKRGSINMEDFEDLPF